MFGWVPNTPLNYRYNLCHEKVFGNKSLAKEKFVRKTFANKN